MANIKLDEGGPNNPLPPLVALLPGGLLILGVITPWCTFGALLFGIFFLGECIGRLGRYD